MFDKLKNQSSLTPSAFSASNKFASELRFLALCLVTLLGIVRTSNAVEIPVTIVGSYAAYPTYEVGYFIDNDISTDYASAGGGTATYVDFQLPGAVAVGYAVYTDRTSSGFFNGSFFGGPFDNVYSYKLMFSDDPTFSTVLWTQEYSSPGYANTDPPSLVNGGYGVTAQYVRWQVTATEGGNSGGAEIHFFTPEVVPEPSFGTLIALGLGLFAGYLKRTRRAKSSSDLRKCH